MTAKLVFLQLNEINFDIVRRYAEKYALPGFSALLKRFTYIETFAEENYDELEPWIQWVSIHTGKKYSEHKIFRLGDAAEIRPQQLFGVLEANGLRVGAVSPMNAWNDLSHPAYFIPDPWTHAQPDSDGFSQRLSDMLHQTVNDNAKGSISWRSIVTILESVVRTLHPTRTAQLVKLVMKSRERSWMKALVLDQLVHMIHLYLMSRKPPDVSFVFLNAGAHIQHHYLLSSEFVDGQFRNPEWYCSSANDPIYDLLKVYDGVIQDYLRLAENGTRLLVATGLSQVPYDRVKFYYRLNDHEEFLRDLGINFVAVKPRMTRDFEIVFKESQSAELGEEILHNVKMEKDGVALFREIENRGVSLFVTLTYPFEIKSGDLAVARSGQNIDISLSTSFVAVKNGMHSTKGYAFFSPGVIGDATPPARQHVANLFALVTQSVL